MGILNLKVYEAGEYREPNKEEIELMNDTLERYRFNNNCHLCIHCGLDTFTTCPKVRDKGNKTLDKYPFIQGGMQYDQENFSTAPEVQIDKDHLLVTSCNRYSRR